MKLLLNDLAYHSSTTLVRVATQRMQTKNVLGGANQYPSTLPHQATALMRVAIIANFTEEWWGGGAANIFIQLDLHQMH